MTVLADKLKAAGIKRVAPNSQLLWQFVKDHPDKTALELSKIAHMPASSTSSLLSQMKNRGMLNAKGDLRRVMRHGKSGHTRLLTWSINPFMNGYELLPLKKPAKNSSTPKVELIVLPVKPTSHPVFADAAVPAPSPTFANKEELSDFITKAGTQDQKRVNLEVSVRVKISEILRMHAVAAGFADQRWEPASWMIEATLNTVNDLETQRTKQRITTGRTMPDEFLPDLGDMKASELVALKKSSLKLIEGIVDTINELLA